MAAQEVAKIIKGCRGIVPHMRKRVATSLAGAELRDQELEIIRAMAESSNAGAAVFDAAGSVVYCNDELTRILGSQSEPISLRLDRFAPFDQTSKAFVQFERFRAGKIHVLRQKCRLSRHDNSPFWADISLSTIATGSGECYFVVHLIDIDKQKTAETAIADSNARWETALEAAGQGMWEFDRQQSKLTLSRGWKRMRGIPADEDVAVDRDSWLARVHPEDAERIKQTSDQQGQGHDGFDIIEYRERHRDGHYIWIYSRGRPYLFDKDGQPLRAIGTDTDITQLKTIEAELATEKERLRVTLQSIADGVITTNAEGRIVFLNQPAEQMTGWSLKDAAGKPIRDIFRSVDDDAAGKVCDLAVRCLDDGQIHRQGGFSKLSSRLGADRYIRETAAPVRTEEGKIIGAVLVFQDATQRRNMQIALEYSAMHDQLTGLPNRTALEHRLGIAIADARETGEEHALFLMDLDHFKAVNDGAGHAAGDALLKEIGKCITACCRKNDCVARIGGDEFVVVLDRCNMKSARRIAQKMVRNISALKFTWQKQSFRVGASIGIAAIDGSITDQLELHKLADAACYSAKRNGRNCVIVGG
jgi:diguanylate cyclase (GGDEF)-like protein/PAS domain S-box-containing protein